MKPGDPLSTGQEALGLPFRAFPSWFLRIECDRCGKATMLNEAHTGERRASHSASCRDRVWTCGCGFDPLDLLLLTDPPGEYLIEEQGDWRVLWRISEGEPQDDDPAPTWAMKLPVLA